MTHEETIAKSREFDGFLVQAKRDLAMPRLTDAKSSMLSVRDLMKPVNDAMNEFRGKLQAKVADMAKDIAEHGDLVIRKVDEEHQENLQDFRDMLGNEHPGQTEDVEGKPQAGEAEGAELPKVAP